METERGQFQLKPEYPSVLRMGLLRYRWAMGLKAAQRARLESQVSLNPKLTQLINSHITGGFMVPQTTSHLWSERSPKVWESCDGFSIANLWTVTGLCLTCHQWSITYSTVPKF